MPFDKVKYDKEYRKEHKAQFNVDLNKEELDELNDLLKKSNLTKVDFIRKAISDLKSRLVKKTSK